MEDSGRDPDSKKDRVRGKKETGKSPSLVTTPDSDRDERGRGKGNRKNL